MGLFLSKTIKHFNDEAKISYLMYSFFYWNIKEPTGRDIRDWSNVIEFLQVEKQLLTFPDPLELLKVYQDSASNKVLVLIFRKADERYSWEVFANQRGLLRALHYCEVLSPWFVFVAGLIVVWLFGHSLGLCLESKNEGSMIGSKNKGIFVFRVQYFVGQSSVLLIDLMPGVDSALNVCNLLM